MLEGAEFEPSEKDRAEVARERFLSSHRAIAACAREFGRLAEEAVDRAGALRLELMIEEEPELRQTPERCIVQIGPAALTMAWLRGPLDSLADGRLLVIAWQGTIARRRFTERPERLNAFGWQEQEPVVGDQMNGADTGFVQALDRPSPEPDELLGQTGELFDALVPLLVQVVIKDNDEKRARDLCAL